jgi:quinol monooxygenase YgiN
MYGLIGKMLTHPGKRDELIAILDDGIREMPGCKSYIIAKDPSDENAVWITEVWESQAEHLDSLKLPQVQAAIAKGRLMIAGFGERFETEPIGGFSSVI